MSNESGERKSTEKIRGSAMDSRSVRIRFSPEVKRLFARVEGAVHGSEHFSPEILENLQEYADEKPLLIQAALAHVATVTKETMRHINATGDEKAQLALWDLASALGEDNAFTLVKTPARDR
jgi:hypothetical protein